MASPCRQQRPSGPTDGAKRAFCSGAEPEPASSQVPPCFRLQPRNPIVSVRGLVPKLSEPPSQGSRGRKRSAHVINSPPEEPFVVFRNPRGDESPSEQCTGPDSADPVAASPSSPFKSPISTATRRDESSFLSPSISPGSSLFQCLTLYSPFSTWRRPRSSSFSKYTAASTPATGRSSSFDSGCQVNSPLMSPRSNSSRPPASPRFFRVKVLTQEDSLKQKTLSKSAASACNLSASMDSGAVRGPVALFPESHRHERNGVPFRNSSSFSTIGEEREGDDSGKETGRDEQTSSNEKQYLMPSALTSSVASCSTSVPPSSTPLPKLALTPRRMAAGATTSGVQPFASSSSETISACKSSRGEKVANSSSQSPTKTDWYVTLPDQNGCQPSRYAQKAVKKTELSPAPFSTSLVQLPVNDDPFQFFVGALASGSGIGNGRSDEDSLTVSDEDDDDDDTFFLLAPSVIDQEKQAAEFFQQGGRNKQRRIQVSSDSTTYNAGGYGGRFLCHADSTSSSDDLTSHVKNSEVGHKRKNLKESTECDSLIGLEVERGIRAASTTDDGDSEKGKGTSFRIFKRDLITPPMQAPLKDSGPPPLQRYDLV